MANVQIKTEKLTPLEEYFRSWSNLVLFLAQTIDLTLVMGCKWYGYWYSEILRSSMCVYLFVLAWPSSINYLAACSWRA